MLNPETKIFIYVLANFAVGYFAATGHIPTASKDILINQTTDILGQIILLATSFVTLYKVLKHPHPVLGQTITTQTTIDGQKPAEITQEIPGDLGKVISQSFSHQDLTAISQQTGLPIGSHN